MNKYIPKVGEECEVINTSLFSPAYEKCFPVFVGEHVIVYNSDSCTERMGKFNYCTFRPISTKADAEREQLLDIMNKIFYGKNSHKIQAVQEIQNLNFTIPKKIKRSDVRRMVGINSSMKGYEDDALVEEIFNLLGDLVEQDIGGAE